MPRNGILDGVRALAVALVLLSHSSFRDRFSGGAIGVDVFFVLSGFLITVLLLREHDRVGSISLRRFYARRTLRIWPAFYTFVIAVLLWGLLVADHVKRAAVLAGMPWVASFTSNITAARGHRVVYYTGHTWSLGVEEQFYIVWPCLLLGLLHAMHHRRQVATTTAALALASAGALIWGQAHGFSGDRLFNGPDMRAEELLMGAVAGMMLVWKRPRIPHAWGALIVSGWLLLLAVTVDKVGSGTPHYFQLQPLVAVLTASTLLVATSAHPPTTFAALLGSRPIRWVGRVSYSVYLWHVPVVIYLVRWEQPHNTSRDLTLLATAAAASALLAAVSYYAIEQPFLRLKDRRFRNRANQGQVLINAPAEAG